MKIIDIHAHPVCTGMVKDARNLRAMGHRGECLFRGDPAQTLLERMDAGGVGMACLMGPNPYDGIELTNEGVRDVVASHPGRFLGFVGVNPLGKGGVETREEVKRAVAEWGFRGVGEVGGDDLLAPEWEAVYETCMELQIPIIVHVGIPLPSMLMKYCHPFMIDELAHRYPELTIIAAHVGVPWVVETISVAVRHPNVHIDIAALPAFNRSLVLPVLGFCIEHGLESQVLFGSDFPIVDPGKYAKDLLKIKFPLLMRWSLRLPDISADFRGKLLGGNASRLLKIQE